MFNIDYEFDVNWLGSCQYSNIAAFYEHYFTLKAEGYCKDELFIKMNIFVDSLEKSPPEDLKKEFNDQLDDTIDGLHSEYDSDTIEEYKTYYIDKTPWKVDIYFNHLRNMAWDLWSAAEYIGGQVFKKLDLHAPVAPGVGPEWNVLAQQVGYRTAVYLILLVEEGLVDDPEESFSGFDT